MSGRNCCRPFRSSYLKIVKERFLLLPITITCTTISGLTWVKRDVDTHCLSSSQNLSFKSQLGVTALKRFPKGTPYNYSSPAVQDVIKVCASYLVSIKEMLSRKQIHKNLQANKNNPTPPPKPRWRPQRITAQRQIEDLCAIQFQELNWVSSMMTLILRDWWYLMFCPLNQGLLLLRAKNNVEVGSKSWTSSSVFCCVLANMSLVFLSYH